MTHPYELKRQAHETDVAVAARMRAFRVQAGLTQTRLADALGLTFQQIQKYERASNRVSAGRLVQIAATLGQPVAAFFEPTPAPLTAHTTGERETLEMVRAFQALPTRALRDAVRHTIKMLADAASGTKPVRKAA